MSIEYPPFNVILSFCRLLLFKPSCTDSNLLEGGQHSDYHAALLAFTKDPDSHCPEWLRKEFLQFVEKSDDDQQQQQQQEQAAMVDDTVHFEDDNNTAAGVGGEVAASNDDSCRGLLESMGVNIEALIKSSKELRKKTAQQQPASITRSPTSPPSTMNVEQRRAFNVILHHLRNGQIHLYDVCGKAGSGKGHSSNYVRFCFSLLLFRKIILYYNNRKEDKQGLWRWFLQSCWNNWNKIGRAHV